ncbi:MAG: DUF4139 domain-containing protein [Desulfovibrionaceae bacterium]
MNYFRTWCGIFFCGLMLWGHGANVAFATEWQSPSTVLLSPQGARISVDAQATVTVVKGEAQIFFYIPSDAQNVEIQAKHATIVQWSSSTERVDALSGTTANRRAALLNEKSLLQGRILALQARINLWITPPTTALSQEQMTARQTSLDTVLPAAQQELSRQQRVLHDVDLQLSSLPDTPRQTQKIVAVLDAAPPTPSVALHYSYTLNNCGWQPDYRFNALPDSGTVDVSLFAKIWQYSGIDWTNAHITLTAQEAWQREPAKVHPWHVATGDSGPAQPMPINARAMPLAAPMLASDTALPKTQAPRMQDSAAFTSWDLGKRDLGEGTVRVSLSQDIWSTPVHWLARPSTSPHVWLMVKHTVTKARAWPTGEATFCIDGATVGNGNFSLKGDVATLYFGIDPRVSVLSATDPRQSGKVGIIDKKKTWDWTWDYTVHNGRATPVSLRIEEAAPQLSDKALSVTYSSKPAPQHGPDHTLYWEITVPADSQHSLHHTVTVTAPQDMKVRPGK